MENKTPHYLLLILNIFGGIIIGFLIYPLIPTHIIVRSIEDTIGIFTLIVVLIIIIRYMLMPDLVKRGIING